MIINIRYHIASLIAIFLALGLGIIIGSTIVGGVLVENMVREQGIWIEGLEKDYLVMREDMKQLRIDIKNKEEKIAFYDQFISEISPYFINNSLKGQKFLTFELFDSGYSNEVEELLINAGAEITASINFMLDEESSRTFDIENYTKEISEFLENGQKNDFINSLVKQDYLKKKSSYNKTIDGIIFIIPPLLGDELANNIQLPFIRMLKSNISIYVINKSNANHLFLNEIRSISNISSINNFDTIPGRISLVLTMQGNKGHYGNHLNSGGLVPPLEME